MRSFRELALGLALAVQAVAVGAAPQAVEAFTADTWPALQAGLKAPLAVVFTTTDCGHCPAAIEHLAARLHRHGGGARLAAVVMDAAPGADDAPLLATPHYRVADRLFAFDGQAAALRYRANPAWRGVTPYVALLAPGRPARWVTGEPSPDEVRAWLDASAAR